MNGQSWPMVDDLSPSMRRALMAWPEAEGHRKDTIRGLRIRGLLLPRARSTLGDKALAYLERQDAP